MIVLLVKLCLLYTEVQSLTTDYGLRANGMLIFDAHLDLAWNALDWNRDLLLPVVEIRRREREAGMTDKGRGCNTVSFPELRRGKVAVFIATLLARSLRPNLVPAIQRY